MKKTAIMQREMANILINDLERLYDSTALSLLMFQGSNVTACAQDLITKDEMLEVTDEVERISGLEDRLDRDITFECLQRKLIALLTMEEGEESEQ